MRKDDLLYVEDEGEKEKSRGGQRGVRVVGPQCRGFQRGAVSPKL